MIIKWSTRTRQSATIFTTSFNWINVSSSRLLHSKKKTKSKEFKNTSPGQQQQQYFVPKDVEKIFRKLRRGDLIEEFPKMKPQDWTILNSSNYLARFQVSLWFEEMETKKLLRNYDLHDVVLQVEGKYHVFNVLGLKHFQPAILEGSSINCYLRQSDSTFKGIILQITMLENKVVGSLPVSQVWVKFKEEFSHIYNESPSPVTIKFNLSRGVFKKQHLAINRAVDLLGGKWLFPKSFKIRPPKISFTEDLHDNVQKQRVPKSTKKSIPSSKVCFGNYGKFSNLLNFLNRMEDTDDELGYKLKWFNSNLNAEQKSAIKMILNGQARPLPYIIFGPPGTGKTATVIEAIKQVYTLDSSSRILVTVPSNAAADLITEHLIKSNLFTPSELVRLNGFSRMDSEIPEIIYEFCMTGECLDKIVQRRLIICTANTAGQFLKQMETRECPDLNFSHVFLDEAGTCTEPEAMIPTVLAGASSNDGLLVLAGDPKQLGPVLLCRHKVNNLLAVPFIERLMESTNLYKRNESDFPDTKYNPMVLTKLVRNYRAHETLLKVPSTLFYENELVSALKMDDPNSSCYSCQNLDLLPRKGVPLIFHGVQGTCFKNSDSHSRYNLEEVSQVVLYIQKLNRGGISSQDIGIITPYRAQVQKLKLALSSYVLANGLEQIPKIASVQEFQGGERTVMIISTVRSSNDMDRSSDDDDADDDEEEDNDQVNVAHKLSDRLGFLFSSKRFNVAVTRAKGLMIIVGDPYILSQNNCWNKLLEYSVELNVYVGCELRKYVEIKSDAVQ